MTANLQDAGKETVTMPGSGGLGWVGGWGYSVGRDIKSECPGWRLLKELQEERQVRGTQEGRGAHSSPGNLL